ncbi:hypothetical protein QBC37DRAFT_431054 [Rhypophila decipiens]|uniref:Small nuclear ribonucleoprotein Prp3 C-terminal domain-containing protein n=1 Tax=Rhypophila decipiens TaxID=261697 RepID=A0AAN6XXZ4_9PEZI|nr:hypothetical protein QBC37DRAFT_431054 [Rhypophila decipiens]
MSDLKMTEQMLPGHLLELQLAQIDLLQAMYPDEDAIAIDDSSTTLLSKLQTFNSDTQSSEKVPARPSVVSLLLTLEADEDKKFQLEIAMPVTCDMKDRDLDEPPRAKIRLVQPPWMSKADASSITSNATKEKEEDLATRIEQIKDAVALHLSSPSQTTLLQSAECMESSSLVRVWFYFPSISTRSKRDDIVNYAPAYKLTGFLLSGKPGVLCLEGPSDKVDAYMKFIKTESWGDIPAHHKKVTERLREAISPGEKRVFEDMKEITDTLGERRGERANRNDMKLLEAWLVERGLGDAFMKVLT